MRFLIATAWSSAEWVGGIKPGHPQENGRHERMHLTLQIETTQPAGRNILQQQAKFDLPDSDASCGASEAARGRAHTAL